jgi:hypothetical protein
MRHWRKMTWVLVAWCSVIVLWAVVGGSSGASQCSKQAGGQYLSAHSAQQACNAGTGIAVFAILGVGFFGFVFFSLIWFMTRPRVAAPPAAA